MTLRRTKVVPAVSTFDARPVLKFCKDFFWGESVVFPSCDRGENTGSFYISLFCHDQNQSAGGFGRGGFFTAEVFLAPKGSGITPYFTFLINTMSVRAYKVKTLEIEEKPTFNLWRDGQFIDLFGSGFLD